MGLPIRIEDRTGDTPYTQRRRQRADPPHILLTTPESLALLLCYEDAPRIFAGLQRVIVDEIHALAESKRGDQLMLCLARLQTPGPRPAPRRPVRHGRRPARPRPLLARHPDPARSCTPIPAPTPTSPMLETDDAAALGRRRRALCRSRRFWTRSAGTAPR